MDISSLIFYICATILVSAALSVILARNPLYSVLSLVVAIFALSSLFITMEAYFVGTILLLVYAGAVLVFFLFVVMCLNLNAPEFTPRQQHRYQLLGWLAGIMFCLEVFLATKSFLAAQVTKASDIRGTIETVGEILFTQYVLPFELTSFLLLIAVFGIVSLAKGAFKAEGSAA